MPAAMKALTASTSCTMVTMLLANRSKRVTMLSTRTAFRTMKMSVYAACQKAGRSKPTMKHLHPFLVVMIDRLEGLNSLEC